MKLSYSVLIIGAMLLMACQQQTEMKKLTVKKIAATQVEAADVPKLLDQADVAFQAIDVVNWQEYSYRPEVSFRIGYTDQAILLHYKVNEASVRAKYKDGGQVWTDACVEFFSIPGQDSIYYNLESNCIGSLILGAGAERTHRQHADEQTLQTIKRWASLGDQTFDERVQQTSWEVALVVPYSAFFLHHITSLEGKTIRANFYKCGDELQQPHFLSWNPIQLPKPNFHTKEFFGEIVFE